MVPSGFMANEPLPIVWPVSVTADTAPSTPATVAADKPALDAPVPASAVVDVTAVPPAHPPPPSTCTRLFQFACAGSQTSMPMPGDVDGASAGPGLPGPTMSLTTHMSAAAVGVFAVGVPERMSGSPRLKGFTKVTNVLSA